MRTQDTTTCTFDYWFVKLLLKKGRLFYESSNKFHRWEFIKINFWGNKVLVRNENNGDAFLSFKGTQVFIKDNPGIYIYD